MMKMIVKSKEEESNGMQDMMTIKMISKWTKVTKDKLEGFWPNMRGITKMMR